MIFAQCCTRRYRKASRCLAMGMIFFLGPAVLLLCAKWDREGARKAWVEAVLQREAIDAAAAPGRETYLKCLRTFRQVYFRDPHYSNSDDAIYETAKIYQELGDRFGNMDDYRNAVKLFEFLTRDYETSPTCPDALLRLGMIRRQQMNDAEGARSAFDRLQKRYGKSEAAATLAGMRVPRDAEPVPAATRALPADPPTAVATRSESPPVGSGPAAIRDVRFWSNENYTRVSIVSDRQLRYNKNRLGNPERVFFDIQTARVNGPLRNGTLSVGDKFLEQIRIGQNRPDVVRVVFDLGSADDLSINEQVDPFGITLEIRAGATAEDPPARVSEPNAPSRNSPTSLQNAVATSSIAANAAAAEPKLRALTDASEPASLSSASTPGFATQNPAIAAPVERTDVSVPPSITARPAPTALSAMPKAALPTSKGDRTMIRMLGLKIGRIVVDPGHGGHDTGTIGPGGLMEKDLVLQVAKQLQKLVQDRLGAEVILTRTYDRFVSLEERTAIANESEADLFLSIHANSSRSRNTSGVETYYLDFARSETATEVAARENASTGRNVRDLQDLVQQIAKADKMAESRELASIIQRCLFSGVRKIIPLSQNRGVRSAPFVVLIGANMPSVLAEVAFISNPRDEKLLKKDVSQHSLANALFQGIEGYMKTLGIDVAQAANSSAR